MKIDHLINGKAVAGDRYFDTVNPATQAVLAQVAAGGIDTADVEVPTMESKLVPGLHLAGELLNVDGDCGGYNLLFAWATGILAGTAMAAEQGSGPDTDSKL